MQEAISGMKPSTPNYQDEREWKITKNADGNGLAVLRFLPQKGTDLAPILLTFKHYFKHNGRWFIEQCPKTIEEKCPTCEFAKDAWDDADNDSKKYWRKKEYIANVLVVKDTGDKENEGKVFLFKFGASIFNKIMAIVAPEEEGEEAKNVFELDTGYNFKMKLKQKGDYNNYDDSAFLLEEKAIPEELQEGVYNDIYDLSEFKAPDKFKSYEDMKKKFDNVMNMTTSAPTSVEKEMKDENKSDTVQAETNEKEKVAPLTTDDSLDDIEGLDDSEFDELFED